MSLRKGNIVSSSSNSKGDKIHGVTDTAAATTTTPSTSSSSYYKKSYPNYYNSEGDTKMISSDIKSSNIATNPIPSSTTAISEFDALRREATKLERHLEDRVAKYQQLAQRFTTDSSSGTNNNNSSNKSNPRSSKFLSIEEEESILSNDISRTISAMSDLVNNRMAPASERTGRSQHTLLVKRYREILFDCSTDFQKTSAAVMRRREALELFSGANTISAANEGEDPDMEHLLRERNAIASSMRMTSNMIHQAEEVNRDLRFQGGSLKNVHGLVGRIAANVPGINYLVDAIKRKRSKDDMILSGVIAVCILFILWYVFVA